MQVVFPRDADSAVQLDAVLQHAGGVLADIRLRHADSQFGIGVTWEHDLHLYLRRVLLDRSMFGTPEDHNLRVYALTEQQESA